MIAYLLTAAILALCALSFRAAAETQAGRVVHVIDGGGLIVLVGEKRVNVRLLHVDAPERAQAYGNQSRQSLIAICSGEHATIDAKGQDRNGRTMARVHCHGVDAAAEQVRKGLAMVFDQDTPADSPLYAIQDEAKATRRGLWLERAPVPPWEWRRRRQ